MLAAGGGLDFVVNFGKYNVRFDKIANAEIFLV